MKSSKSTCWCGAIEKGECGWRGDSRGCMCPCHQTKTGTESWAEERGPCPQGCGSEIWHIDVDCPEPQAPEGRDWREQFDKEIGGGELGGTFKALSNKIKRFIASERIQAKKEGGEEERQRMAHAIDEACKIVPNTPDRFQQITTLLKTVLYPDSLPTEGEHYKRNK